MGDNRGAVVSGSLYREVQVGGSNVTIQRVPHEQVLGVYFQARGVGGTHGLFAGDSENEVLFYTKDVGLRYVGKSGRGADTERWWAKYGKKRDWDVKAWQFARGMYRWN
jgi:hypothetical protein